MTITGSLHAELDRPSNVLLAVADAGERAALEASLSSLRLEIVQAQSDAETAQHMRNSEFSIILLDTELTTGTEGEVAALIGERVPGRHPPIIFLAPAPEPALAALRAFGTRAADFLIKPVNPEALRAKVAGLIEFFSRQVAAERQAEQLRLLIESAQDYAIFMLDAGGHVLTWNAGAKRIKGYDPESIIGKHFSIFYPAEDLARNWPAHELEVARVTGRFEDEGWRVRQDGRRFWANVIITALHDRNGEVVGFSKITRDLTERKFAEEVLAQANAELESRVAQRTAELETANAALKEADRRKDEFLAMLAHELRNPLAPMRNAMQIMKLPGLGSETVCQAREMVERQVEHLVRIVDDLLDVSRIMRGRVQLRDERVELATVFARAVEMCQALIDARGQQLTVALPPEPLRLRGDLMRLTQVVSNLLSNAAKYTETAGRISLVGERQGKEIVIRVRDTGVGIDPDLLPRIFDLFVQADLSLARSQGGLGIGLTLVRRLVELHGGSVSASSPGPGQGSEFMVRVPELLEEISGDDVTPKPLQSTQSPRRVLVVDDNVDAAESTALLLRFLGHEIRVVHDGPAALEATRQFRPEIVLLDIGLPGMSGYEVARALRAQRENNGIVIAAVTGYGHDDDRRRSQESGCDYHLTKPLAPQVLTAFVDAPASARPTALSNR